MVEKMIKIYQIFFSKKRNIKRAQKPSFIKIVPTEPILAYICDMALGPLPLRVGTTIVAVKVFLPPKKIEIS